MKNRMKSLALFTAMAFVLASSACAQKSGKKGSPAAGEMKTQMDSLSYIMGAGLGQNIRQAEIEGVIAEQVLQGILDGLQSDEAMKISQEEGTTMIRNYMQKQEAVKTAKSLEKSEAFMKKIAEDKTLQRTESGVYYKVLVQGSGPKPVATDKVKVHYEGKTTDGVVFDSSYERGTPAEFPLNRVIPGWTEMLQYMETGTTVEATLPPSLAYGERGSPPKIGPNEVLIFKIELIDITTGQ